ncbi:MAG: sulfatase-like hydrolase/transferase [Verrucomicrobiae bacterium]|nr:sulfatase-like hydrolase/transferase [Verrucomicrobiae bacterium]NNJ86754.1 sulfatase-like hydrolase/transferase [Akkermansiaceae bacterium]
MRKSIILTTALLLSWVSGISALAERPNIVFLLADDLGPGDVGSYHRRFAGTEAKVPTPHMDRLAKEGMSFTDAQLPAALCAPNRFCILTGNYTFRSIPWGSWFSTGHSALTYGPKADSRKKNPHQTVGGLLQKVGYRTAFIGKMHLGGDFYDRDGNLLRSIEKGEQGQNLEQIDFTRPFRNGMREHGFDYTFVSPCGIQGPLYAYFENDKYRAISDFAGEVDGLSVSGRSYFKHFPKRSQMGHSYAERKGYGDSEFDSSEHGPILTHFAEEFIRKHRKEHPDKPFLLYYASPSIHTPHRPSRDGIVAHGSSGLGIRADSVCDFDMQVGRILSLCDELGMTGNTLFILTSDNGGVLSNAQPMIRAGQHPIGPYRGNKELVWEGGRRVPMIWKWGGDSGRVIPAGVVCDQLVSVLDWVASIADMTGQTPADDQQQDSTSLWSYLLSKKPNKEEALRRRHYFQGEDRKKRTRRGIRMDIGSSKWVYIFAQGKAPQELYDLSRDISEKKNLLAGHYGPAAIPAKNKYAKLVRQLIREYHTMNNCNDPRSMPVKKPSFTLSKE